MNEPVAVVTPGKFHARCSVCNVEIENRAEWEAHVKAAAHSANVAARVSCLQEQLDQVVAKLNEDARQTQAILSALTTIGKAADGTA